MNIIVCARQVQDPEIPPAKFRIDPVAKRAIPPEGIPAVINPFDERAVELALRLKESSGGGTITVLSMGGTASADVVKRAISMGADDGAVLSDPSFEGSDSYGVAHILCRAVEKVGKYDLILCGRQASDWDEGLVGLILAEVLDLPVVTLAMSASIEKGELQVKRVTFDGYQVFSVPTPAVLTVSQEVGRPRLPSGRGIITAARKQVPVWTAADLATDPALVGAAAATRSIVKLSLAERERKCEIVQAETPAEAGAKLADRLREAGAL